VQATNAGQQRHVHTQRFAFRAPQEDDESVKMSNATRRRSSALSVAPRATHPCTGGLQNGLFLFDTNERFFQIPNFATNRQQSTSIFLFDTNEKSPNTDHQSPKHGDSKWPKN
jgi:hypothetical protein